MQQLAGLLIARSLCRVPGAAGGDDANLLKLTGGRQRRDPRARLAAGCRLAATHLLCCLASLSDNGIGLLARQDVLGMGGAQPAVGGEDLDRAQIVRGVADLHRAASDACRLGAMKISPPKWMPSLSTRRV